MAELVLLLQLEGPMQSWGVRSRWDVRDTGLEPSKSGVIGLIGCALGLRRDDPDLERLDRSLLFGVRIDHPGWISTDYHTVTGYHRTAAGEYKHSGGTAKSLAKAREHDESTIVSPRDYLHDAAFLVGFTSNDHELLRQISGITPHSDWPGDLQRPYWPLYLGRKSCVPTRPIFERLTGADEYPDLECALRNEPWNSTLSCERPQTQPEEKKEINLTAWIECPEGGMECQERQDAIRRNRLRFYDFRYCRRLNIQTSSLQRRIP